MYNIKSISTVAALFFTGIAMPISAQANDADKALEGAQKCYAFQFDDPGLVIDDAIMVCAQAVADLTAIRQIDGKDIDLETIDMITDVAGTSAMKWAALEFSKADGTVTSNVCTPVGFANNLFDILDEPKSSTSKENSGANMLSAQCRSKGIPLE